MSDSSLQTKKYCKYTREMRLKLIKFVDQDKLSTAHAARILGIKQTSACRILKSYHKHNKIFEKKTDKLNRQKLEAQDKLQKDSDFQNIPSQQKNLEATKKLSETTTAIGQSAFLTNLIPNGLQNGTITPVVLNGERLGLYYHPLISLTSEYYPIYCPNICPLPYNYY